MTTERDPFECEEKINKRRELLKQLYAENQAELSSPALINNAEIINEKLECTEPRCKLRINVDPVEEKKAYKTNIIAMICSLLGIALLVLVALLVGKFGQ